MSSNQIMIVEDERIVAADLQISLEEFGYAVIGVESSGESAVRKANKLKPDLILMDIMLKGKMNGIEAAFDIGNNHNIPVIYITAYADNLTIKHALETNPFGYILKPFKKGELKTSIEMALHKKALVTSHEQLDTKPNESELKHVRTISSVEAASLSLNGISASNYYFRSDSTLVPVCLNEKIAEAKADRVNTQFADIFSNQNTSLFKLINELKNDTISQKGINMLIKVSYKLAVFKVKKNINKIFNLKKRWDLSVEDIAVESISGLFVRNSKRDMLNLRYSLLNWEEHISNSTDALFFLNKAVGLSVDQCINKMIRDSDPAFAKVLDTLNYTIKRYDYNKTDYFGVMYIVKNSSGQVCGSTIDYEEFNSIPLDMNQSKKDILAYLCSYLEECTAYFPAIPLNALIERILGSRQKITNEVVFESPSHFHRVSTDDIIYNSLTRTKLKLKRTYIDTGKISESEGAVISSALSDIVFDMREGNTIWQLSDYIKVYKKDLTKKEYKEKYQFVIEYLVKLLKQMILRRLG